MNENIDLTEILKDCHKGTKLYSPLFGYVELKEIDTSKVYSVNVKLASGLIESFTREGKLYDRDYYKDTECVLFPSKEQRDWSKFTAPWLKKEKDTINKEGYGLKSYKDEDVHKFMQYIEKQLPNRSCDKYAFAKDLLVWLEKQGKQEVYCSFEVAKLLKEKGFDAQCRAAYTNYGQLFTTQIQQYITNIICSKGNLWECIAPTHQMAMKWLREVHNIDICALPYQFDYICYSYEIKIYKNKEMHFRILDSITYEEAVEAALKYTLEILI